MDNKASKNREREMAFIVDAAGLQHLEGVLSEVGTPLQYSVKFSDDSKVEYHAAEDVIKQPNISERSITSITVSTPSDHPQSAYVVLRTKPSPQVEYAVNGTQQRVVYLGGKLDEWVASIRQWYSLFHSAIFAWALICFAFYVPLFLWKHLAPHIFSEAIIEGKTDSWIRGTSVFGLWGIELLALKLFPNGTFAIGQGVQRNDFLKSLRVTIVGIILSVLAGMLVEVLKH